MITKLTRQIKNNGTLKVTTKIQNSYNKMIKGGLQI